MRSENPAEWTRTPLLDRYDAPAEQVAGDRLESIVKSAAVALGCKSAFLYLKEHKVHVLAAGSGPQHVPNDAFYAAFRSHLGETTDFMQCTADPSAADACARLGIAPPPPACFAAATRVCHDDRYYGVLVVADEAPRSLPLSPAQSYVLRAFAGQIAALLELKVARDMAVAADVAYLEKIERLRLFESVAVHARDAILITEAEPLDLPGPRILYCNKSFTETTGYSAEEAIGQTPRILQGPNTDPVARAKLRAAFAKWEPIQLELINYRKDGTEFWVELSIVPVANDSGWYTHWVSVQRDVTERKQAEELTSRIRRAEVQNEALATEIQQRKRVEAELLYTAFHDNLTRLRNRAFFMDRVKSVLTRPADGQVPPCAVLFLDLDRFKIVNDSLGHQAGDALLKEIARRLKSCARPQDTLARLGGDEFALLIEDGADVALATSIAERIIEALRAPVRIGRQEIFASCSIGIVLSSERCSHAEAIIRDADVAMYVAKRSGFGDYAVFDESMVAEAVATLTLQSDLQAAIEHDEFDLAYQPIVDPEGGQIKGFEALLRWRHPVRGILQPDQFVPVAEEMGLIRQIDRWVMHMACSQLAQWRQQFDALDLSMSINTSASEFEEPDFIDELKETLSRFGLPPRTLELEITESIFLNPDRRVTATIAEIRDYGVRIGLDDFGTGYSSLSYLNRNLTDTIKIDKSFITSLCSDDRTLAIVLLIIQLAKTLNVDVVAEGVETEEQALLLASMSCSHAQGYYYSRPVPAVEATELIKAGWSRSGGGEELGEGTRQRCYSA